MIAKTPQPPQRPHISTEMMQWLRSLVPKLTITPDTSREEVMFHGGKENLLATVEAAYKLQDRLQR